jgi:hypothetical protein
MCITGFAVCSWHTKKLQIPVVCRAGAKPRWASLVPMHQGKKITH